MGSPKLKLRCGSYHWRRKIMVAGQSLPFSISLRTGNFYRARLVSARLSVAVESLRMAYPPDLQDPAVQTMIQQAELLAGAW